MTDPNIIFNYHLELITTSRLPHGLTDYMCQMIVTVHESTKRCNHYMVSYFKIAKYCTIRPNSYIIA